MRCFSCAYQASDFEGPVNILNSMAWRGYKLDQKLSSLSEPTVEVQIAEGFSRIFQRNSGSQIDA